MIKCYNLCHYVLWLYSRDRYLFIDNFLLDDCVSKNYYKLSN